MKMAAKNGFERSPHDTVEFCYKLSYQSKLEAGQLCVYFIPVMV